MRFSLMTSMILLTLACLVVLVYRERDKTIAFKEKSDQLAVEINAQDSNLPKDIRYYRDSVEPDLELQKIHDQVTARYRKDQLARLDDEIAKVDSIAVFHLPVLEDKKQFAVYIPKGKEARFVSVVGNPVTGEKPKSEFDPFGLSRSINEHMEPGIHFVEIAKKDTPEEDDIVWWAIQMDGRELTTINGTKSNFRPDAMVWHTAQTREYGFMLRHSGISTFETNLMEPNTNRFRFVSFYAVHKHGDDAQGNPIMEFEFLNLSIDSVSTTDDLSTKSTPAKPDPDEVSQ